MFLGQIDDNLVAEVKGILGKGHDDNWDPKTDNTIDGYTYEVYKSELFGVLVSSTTDDALGVVRGVAERGYGEDGFKALNDLQHRFDSRTAASLLHAFLAVVNPQPITKIPEVQQGLQKWESAVS